MSISKEIAEMLKEHGISEDRYNEAREQSGLDANDYDDIALEYNAPLGKSWDEMVVRYKYEAVTENYPKTLNEQLDDLTQRVDGLGNAEAYKYLNKTQSLKSRHDNFNIRFIQTLILLEKFKQAFAFANDVWDEKESFFEADLLLGLESFIDKDYLNAQKHFERLNKVYSYNNLFDDFLGNFLLASVKAAENNQNDSFKFTDPPIDL